MAELTLRFAAPCSGSLGVKVSAYDPNRPDERLPNRLARILFFEDLPLGVLRKGHRAAESSFRRFAPARAVASVPMEKVLNDALPY